MTNGMNLFDTEWVYMCLGTSTAVATSGLRRCVEHWDKPEVRAFANNYLYIDDGLVSFATEEEAVAVLKNTQKILFHEERLKLHKITSNTATLMKTFHPEDLDSELNTIVFGK